MSTAAQAELARGYKDHYQRSSLISAARKCTGWTDAEFARNWMRSGRPNSEYWQWIDELTTDPAGLGTE